MSKRSRVRGRLRLVTALMLGYWCLLFIATHVPLPAVKAIGANDKLIHFAGYATLAFLAAWALSQKSALTWKGYLTVWLVVALYGVVDELLQMIPMLHRSADRQDWYADILGAACALIVYWLWIEVRRRLSTSR